MVSTDFIKSKIFKIVDVIEHSLKSVIMNSFTNRITGNISAVPIFSSEQDYGIPIYFGTYIQIIEGNAEVVIYNKSILPELGKAIIISAHFCNRIKTNEKLNKLSTLTKLRV
jgi:hypothetical protein